MITSKSGFTLIELLVAMAILAILSTIGFGSFQTTRLKANDAKRKADLSAVSKALEAFVNDYGTYPTSDASGRIVCKPETSQICGWGSAFSDTKGTVYMAKLPVDSGGTYMYSSGTGASFTLYARLQNLEDPDVVTGLSVPCGTGACNYKLTSSNLP